MRAELQLHLRTHFWYRRARLQRISAHMNVALFLRIEVRYSVVGDTETVVLDLLNNGLED